MEATTGLMLIVWLLGLVLVVAWIILPFALIGTKPLLRELLAQAKETNARLKAAQEGRKP
ncbi:hypothetical protein [Polaromonas jejuensis]|nr:hypothetical protein [Polaromonas jejuensis]